MTHLHALVRRNRATRWACLVLDCDGDTSGLACVLLLVSVCMTLIALVLVVA